MTTIGQKSQLEMMECVALASGSTDYDSVRHEMFAAFDYEYGKGKWTFIPLSDKQERDFKKWLISEK